MAELPYGHVRITCDDPVVNIVVLLSDEPIRYTAGFGGWEVTQRPRQVGMTSWQGQEPLQLTLGLMFNTFDTPGTISSDVAALRRIARGDDESPPGVCTIEGIPLGPDDWIIEGLEFGEALRRADGYAVRQEVTLTLREYVPPSYLQLRRKALAGGKGKTKIITTKRGDTPASIARRMHCKWTDLRTLNRKIVKKANQKLKTGTKLRVPVATTKRKKRSSSSKGQRKR
jgi:hypothetical protein